MNNKNETEQDKVLEFRDIRLEKKMNEMCRYLVDLIGVDSFNSAKKDK